MLDTSLKINDNFDFWTPAVLEKGETKINKEGKKEQEMLISGVASTIQTDLDGETLLPEGFDLTYFKERGLITWQHGQDPSQIIGEPVAGRIADNKFHIKAKLWPFSPLAKGVYGLMTNLEKSKSNRKLGWSIEGKVTELDPVNPKIVKKAKITNVTLTPTPKNKGTFANIIQKGIIKNIPLKNLNSQIICEFKKGQDSYKVDGNYNIFVNGKNLRKDMTTKNKSIVKEDLENKITNLAPREFESELKKALILIHQGCKNGILDVKNINFS